MSDERIPAETFPVQDFVREELEAREWSLDDLALRMGTREEFGINRLVVGMMMEIDPQKGLLIGYDGARGLAKAFGTSEEFWLNIDRQWQPDEWARYDEKLRAVSPTQPKGR